MSHLGHLLAQKAQILIDVKCRFILRICLPMVLQPFNVGFLYIEFLLAVLKYRKSILLINILNFQTFYRLFDWIGLSMYELLLWLTEIEWRVIHWRIHNLIAEIWDISVNCLNIIFQIKFAGLDFLAQRTQFTIASIWILF